MFCCSSLIILNNVEDSGHQESNNNVSFFLSFKLFLSCHVCLFYYSKQPRCQHVCIDRLIK